MGKYEIKIYASLNMFVESVATKKVSLIDFTFPLCNTLQILVSKYGKCMGLFFQCYFGLLDVKRKLKTIYSLSNLFKAYLR